MTICVAARCAEDFIFCAADRLITTGDDTYEPAATPKIFFVTASLLFMMSGDATFYTEVYDRVHGELSALGPEIRNAITAREMVQKFIWHRNAAKCDRADSAVLHPLGITRQEFLRGAAPHLSAELADALANFKVPTADVIVAGLDAYGAQLYVIRGDDYSCYNAVGFAAVGMGARHAESVFMSARHSYSAPASDTVLLTYAAKKTAEVAPGVGQATDIYMIMPNGEIVTLKPEVLAKLDKEYRKLTRARSAGLRAASREMKRFLDSLSEPNVLSTPDEPALIGSGAPITLDSKTLPQ